VTIDTQYAKKDCEKLTATTQSTSTSFTMLINTRDACTPKLSPAAIGGIVAGGVVVIAVLVTVGVIAFKKGYARSIFRSEERKETYVT